MEVTFELIPECQDSNVRKSLVYLEDEKEG